MPLLNNVGFSKWYILGKPLGNETYSVQYPQISCKRMERNGTQTSSQCHSIKLVISSDEQVWFLPREAPGGVEAVVSQSTLGEGNSKYIQFSDLQIHHEGDRVKEPRARKAR